ncbi:MAG: hypothetical protein FJ291_02025 [Planctomycetes bacterium]|nr:hypothetical protein [Planctomycetota bacterium]
MMVSRRFWLVSVAAVAPAWLCAGLAAGATLGPIGGGTTDRRPQRYYVLQVLGASGAVTFETCADIEYQKRLKDYKEEYEKEQLGWMKQKAEAKKNKTEFKEPRPKGPTLMRKMETSYRKEEDARAAAEKFQKQWDEELEKRRAKKEGAAKEDTPKKEE